ncbi:MAG: hypothetical protein JXA98_02425 [Methanosarcinaceae archaeon]|nr:hypothetical protein [Methanosarcinaceae archaeon]
MNRIPIMLVVLVLFSAGCIEGTGNEALEVANDEVVNETVETEPYIEVIHFHGNSQCYSCITVGEYAEETVNTYFSDELESGKLVFRHLNFQSTENSELAWRYGAAYSSLWIGSYTKEGFSAEQDTNVWYKIDDRTEYMNYLRTVINEKLTGL